MKYQSKIYAESLLEVFEKKPQAEILRNFLRLVRKNGDFSKLPKILYDFKKLYNKKHGIKEVKVEISRDDKNIVREVQEILHLKHEPDVVTNKDILGGVVVTIDNEVIIDGSIKTRLQKI